MTVERRHSASPYEDRYGFCRGLRKNNHIEVAGTAPIGPDGKTVAGGPFEQAMRCFSLSIQTIEALGGQRSDVVRTRMYITDPAVADEVGRAHAEAFGDAPPVATMVVVAGLLDPDWVVETEVQAQLDRS
ncbi:MAG: RidA family protein [Myxococcota bacterium]